MIEPTYYYGGKEIGKYSSKEKTEIIKKLLDRQMVVAHRDGMIATGTVRTKVIPADGRTTPKK